MITCDVAHIYCEKKRITGLPAASLTLDRPLRLATSGGGGGSSLLIVPRAKHYYRGGEAIGKDGDIIGAADAFIGGFIGAGLSGEALRS